MLNKILRLITLAVVISRFRKQDDDALTPAELSELKASLGDSLRADGSIDFDRLKETSRPLDLRATKQRIET